MGRSSVAQTGPVPNPDVTCVAIDFYDSSGNVAGLVAGLVQAHQPGSAAYPAEWTGEVDTDGQWKPYLDIAWSPEHISQVDRVLARSYWKDSLRLTGISATAGDASVEFALPRPPAGRSGGPARRVSASEVFLFITGINPRTGNSLNKTLGIVDLAFEGGHIESYELKIGQNIRSWWSGNTSVQYVFTFDRPANAPYSLPEARQFGLVPAAGGYAGLDVVRLVVPAQWAQEELVSIRVIAKPVVSYGLDVAIKLAGITVFYNPPTLVFRVTEPPVSRVADIKPGSLTLVDHDNLTIPWPNYSKKCYSGGREGEKHTDAFVREDLNGNGIPDPGEDLNGNGILDLGEDLNGNGIPDPGEDLNGNGRLDIGVHEFIMNNSHFRAWTDIGPLPPGTWRVGPSEPHTNKNGVTYYQFPLTSIGGTNSYTRGGFFIHPWGDTTGCIATENGQYDNFLRDFEAKLNVLVALEAGTLKLKAEYTFPGSDTIYPKPNPYPYPHAEVAAHSPVNLLLEDASGRFCGYDPVRGEAVNEIDGATYSGPGTEPQVLTYPLYSPSPGLNYVTVIPVGAGGAYRLTLSYYQDDGSVLTTEQTGEVLAGGEAAYLTRIASDGPIIVDESGPPLLTSVECDPPAILFASAGQTRQLAVTGTYSDSTTVDLTSASNGTTYESGNDAVASVSNEGLVTSAGAGTTNIVIRSSGFVELSPVTVVSVSPWAADFDGDGDVDLNDFAALESCLGSPDAGLPTGCEAKDFDLDGDVDLLDFAGFQIEFGGSQ